MARLKRRSLLRRSHGESGVIKLTDGYSEEFRGKDHQFHHEKFQLVEEKMTLHHEWLKTETNHAEEVMALPTLKRF